MQFSKIALVVVIILGYLLNWHWTGLVPETSEPKQHMKTLWDWLQLLVIPLMLAIGAFWLNQLQKSREERATEQRDTTERELARDKQREDLLQTYLDRMSELLLEKQLHSPASPYEILAITRDEVRNVARVRTITILVQLDARRIGYVFAFLREAGLMSTTSESIVSLKGANLTKINFSQARIEQADLSKANLNDADLSKADLSGANLSQAILREAYLLGADLSGANLLGADLSQAILGVADLSQADLIRANLSDADLSGAKVTEEQLKTAKSLKGATMPDGSKHP